MIKTERRWTRSGGTVKKGGVLYRRGGLCVHHLNSDQQV